MRSHRCNASLPMSSLITARCTQIIPRVTVGGVNFQRKKTAFETRRVIAGILKNPSRTRRVMNNPGYRPEADQVVSDDSAWTCHMVELMVV